MIFRNSKPSRRRQLPLEFEIERCESRVLLTTLPASASLLMDINPAGDSTPSSFVELGNEILFFADSNNGRELWKTNGSANGTELVKDINTAGSSVSFGEIVVAGGKGFFAANDGAGSELWITDGTTDGTFKIDINTAAGSDPSGLTALGDSIVFIADDGVKGRELWISDGTVDGTDLLADINANAADAFAESDRELHLHSDGYVYFGADNGTHGKELWRTDGLTASLWADINTNGNGTVTPTSHSNPAWLTTVGDTLYFSANEFVSGVELWKYTTGSFTTRAANIYTGAFKSSTPMWLTELNGNLVFSAKSSLIDLELWSYDGSTATRLKDINPGSNGSTPVDFKNSNGLVYFTANQDPANGAEPWVTDGTAAGTKLLKDINPGAGGDSLAVGFHAFKEFTFFTAIAPGSGNELYVSDGTPSGTSLYQEFNTGPAFGARPSFFSNEDFMLLAAGDASTGIELSILDTRNAAPMANDDSGLTDEDTATQIDVLANDSDPENGQLTVTSASVIDGFGLASVVNNQVAYDPGTNYNFLANGEQETVAIMYEITDPLGATATAFVTVVVSGTNDSPELSPISGPTENVLLGQGIAYSVTADDADTNDVLETTWEVTNSDGNVVGSDEGSTLTFTPAEFGVFTITVTLDDGQGGFESATSELTVAASFRTGPQLIVQGTDANDRIKVTGKSDVYNVSVGREKSTYDADGIDKIVIYGLDGNDVISFNSAVVVDTEVFAGDGNDRVTGGSGTDTVFGGAGADKLNGKNGEDNLFGEADNDKLIGGNDSDFLSGGDDDDTISGGSGDDEMEGNAGNDKLNGGQGDDLMLGGEDDDRLIGSAGNDEMYGGIGNDFLSGGGGDDDLDGGLGIDILKGGPGDNSLFDEDDEL